MAESASQIPLALTSHNNQSLFSDHYLDDILRRTEIWRAAIPQAKHFLVWLRELYAQEKAQLPHYNENQLEDKWFKPIFARLGHENWEGQAVIPGWQGSIKKPDFFFFPDDEARKTAVSKQNSNEYAQLALAVAEVKQWEVNLSKKTGSQPIFADQNPMYQIDTYLSLTNLEWGVLSNGRFWRLLHKNSSRTLETFFEIDLLAALEQADETSATAVATYFWLFFNQTAFLPDKNGQIFLDTALEQSRAYALALEADLRDNAYRALEHLIRGFFAANADLDADDAQQRDRVYRNSLYLLYRLLFLFYGESRALLPMHNTIYKEDYSLQRLAQAINHERSNMSNLPATARRHWNRLHELFRLISGMDAQLNADLGVPRYNGGLFDPQQHPFLETHVIGDRYLAHAIDYLAYRRVRADGRFQGFQAVDYRTLDVRQLGSVYEGLLEYRVAVASEDMVTVRKKGVEKWVTASSRGRAKPLDQRPAGELYLATDKGERKATGSYYTPDYIVEYIVENTLGPLVEQARERVKASIKQQPVRAAAARQQKSAKLFEDEILRLNVLDPAMGSGHFLVEATHYLARVLATDEYVVGSTTNETDLLYWKRRVVEACIYGVDKNPMAVELAKLSLWLKTAAADKPLSFLDHHLQHGDSLIGAWLKDLKAAPTSSKKTQETQPQSGQLPLFDDSAFTRDINRAVADVMTIERLPTLDIETVYAKEKTWQDIQQTYIAHWRRLADLWVSHYFGNTMTPAEYRALANRLQGRDSLLSEAQAEAFLTHPAVTDNDYFHWELAFPEVFFDEYGRSLKDAAGFDAVIGNPPYVLVSGLLENYLREIYEVSRYFIDLYPVMTERGIDLLRIDGEFGFIVPEPWLTLENSQPLRKFILSNTWIRQVITFENKVFFDAVVDSIVILLCKSNHKGKVSILKGININNIIEQLDEVNQIKQVSLAQSKNQRIEIRLSSRQENILHKVTEVSSKFNEIANITIGIQAYNSSKHTKDQIKNRVFHSSIQESKMYLPELGGSNIARYLLNYEGNNWVKFGEHLYDFRPMHYYVDPRILIREIPGIGSHKILACYTKEIFCYYKTVLGIISKPNNYSLHYFLALLNSSFLSWVYPLTSNKMISTTFPRITVADLRNLPIRKIEFLLSEEQKKQALNNALAILNRENLSILLSWIDTELASNQNEIIHDLLAHQAKKMTKLYKEKYETIEAFWLDLEGVTAEKTFAALRNKGKWQQSLHKAVPAARPFVSADSRSSVSLDASLSWNEAAFKGFVKLLVKKVPNLSDIVAVYRKHAPAVAALDQRLSATDNLIDQIVYKLYGLSDAEIAIVEGR